jgi:hypothetical protein
MEKTESELAFEEYCESNAIPFHRLPTSQQQSPDYMIEGCGGAVVVEVKQFNDSEEDIARLARVREGVTRCHPDTTDARVAEKLKTAANQLRGHSKAGLPTVVCLWDARTLGILGSDNVKIAMYGEERVVVSMNMEHRENDIVSPIHPGGNQKCTPRMNTSLSATAILRMHLGELTLAVFHNHFARVKLPKERLARFCKQQYALDPKCLPYEWQWLFGNQAEPSK